MKAAFILAVAAGFVAAELDLSALPDCSVTCISDAFSGVGCTDTDCACDADVQTSILAEVSTCLTAACTADELTEALAAQEAMCPSTDDTTTSTDTTTSAEAAPTDEEEDLGDVVVDDTEDTTTTSWTSYDNATATATETTDAADEAEATATTIDEDSGAAQGSVVGFMVLAAAVLAAF